MLTFICIYMCVCMSFYDKTMFFNANVYVYVSMSLFEKAIRNCSRGGMIAYIGK